MWHSGWGGPCFRMTLQNCPGRGGVLHRMSSFFLSFFFGSDWYSSTETLCSNLFQMLWACHCLFSFLPYYVSSIATTISFMPLFFPPRRVTASSVLPVVWQLACCVLSAYHSYSLLPLSLKRGKKTLHFSFLSVQFISLCFAVFYSWVWSTEQRSGLVNANVQTLYQWVFVRAGLSITQACCRWLTLSISVFPFYSLFHYFLSFLSLSLSPSPRQH